MEMQKMRRLWILALVAAGAALPPLLMAEEKEKIDGCLTTLYNYPANVNPTHEVTPPVTLRKQRSENPPLKANFKAANINVKAANKRSDASK